MKAEVNQTSSTSAVITIELTGEDLQPILRHTYNQFRSQVKADGFRPGRAPDNIVEREIGPEHIQSHVIEDAARKFFGQVIDEKQLRPVGQPEVEIKKFVPFDNLVLEFKTDVIGTVKLANYKQIKKTKTEVKISSKEIDSVITNLSSRAATRMEVKRPAKDGDEIMIDMSGQRGGKDVPGTKAKDYPVLLGSERFVPGFEQNLKGTKAGDSKEFDVIFPADYNEPTLQSQKVEFSVTVKKVQELKSPKLDAEFAKSIGPFKDMDELRADIKKQLEVEKAQDARRRLTDEVVDEVVAKSQLDIPAGLLSRQQQQLWEEFEGNVKQQGMEVDDYLKKEQKTRKDIEVLLAKDAQKRVKTAIVLSEVAKAEKLTTTPEEVEIRTQILKGRYQDKQMQTELDKPEAKKDITDQLLIEKTVDKLVTYATKKN